MTFSIVARDPQTGAFGVATATGGPAVGSLVPHARAGVGALATQGFTNPLYAPDGLARLALGEAAQQVVDALTQADAEVHKRQLIVIDAKGRTAGWSGSGLTQHVGLHLEDGLAAAGNLLAADMVVPAMVDGFRAERGPLELRLLAALRAGEAQGGDARGIRSAAILVCCDQPYPAIDVRVDLSPVPLDDLETVLESTRTGEYAEFFAALPRR